jgi:polyketide biosynthesis enoyl-CoA hydratase PksI
MSGRVAYERDADGVAVLHLHDRAERNALGPQLAAELAAGVRRLGEDRAARVCVVRGLDDVFCAGGHLDMLRSLARGETAPGDIPLLRAVLEAPVPMIAAMAGHAVGGGLVLGLACDVVLLARESRYGCPFVDLGFTPGAGTTRLLERAVGEFVAAEMMFGGELVRGARLASRPGINYVLPRAQVWPKALDLARRFAGKPREVLEPLKRALSLRKRVAFEEARTVESFLHEACFARPETAARIEQGYLGAGPEAVA